MTSYDVRWVAVALLTAGWAVAMLAAPAIGATVHLLAVAAAGLVAVQLRTRPALTAFQTWQQKQSAPRKPAARRR